MLFAPIVRREPAGENRREKRDTERDEDEKKAEMQAGHHYPEQEKRELFKSPRQPVSNLENQEADEHSQEEFAAGLVKWHWPPFRDVRYADRQLERDIERIHGELRAVWRNRQHREAEHEDEGNLAALRRRPRFRLDSAQLKFLQAAHPINENRAEANDERPMRIHPKKHQRRKKPRCPVLSVAKKFEGNHSEDEKQITEHLRTRIKRYERQ